MIAETFGHQSRRPIVAGRGVDRVRLGTPRRSYAFLAVSAIRPLAVRNRMSGYVSKGQKRTHRP